MAKKDRDILKPAAPPQPTKRDRVIAQRLAQVAEGDSITSISNQNNIPEQDLLNANPGVVTVRPGQVVNIPSTGGGNMYSPTPVTNPFTGAQTFSGTGTANVPTTRLTPLGNQQPQQQSQNAGYTGTAGYWGQFNAQSGITGTPPVGYGQPQAPQQPYLGASSYMNPALRPQASNLVGGDKQGQLGASAQPAATFPTDDKGRPLPYTGNPNDPNTQLWKDYWNASARAGVDLAGRNLTAPTVMTRDQIWEMKAAQRRRQAASAAQDGINQPAYQYDTTGYGIGSPLVRNITWSIRG